MRPYTVENLQGVRVGVMGVANPDTRNVTLPEATEGLSFLDLRQTAAAVNRPFEQPHKRNVETIVTTPSSRWT